MENKSKASNMVKKDNDEKKNIKNTKANQVVSYDDRKSLPSVLHRTSLPNVLEEYGMKTTQNAAPTQADKSQDVEKKPHARKRHHRPMSGMYESQAEKEKLKTEKYMQAFNHYEKAKKYYYSRYMKNLKSKIEIQRENIQRKTDDLHNKIKEKQQQEEHDRHHLKKRLQRVEIDHNDDFLQKLPQSDYYKIVKLEQTLKARGMLGNQMEIDEFWANIKKPDVFYSHFGVYPKGDFDTDFVLNSEHSYGTRTSRKSSSKSSISKPHSDNDGLRKMMSRIQETRESSRPTTRHVPQQNQIDDRPDPSEPLLANMNTENMTITEIGRKAAYELDKKCPQVELPELACFQLELGEKPPDPEQEVWKAELKSRERSRRIVVKKVQKMFKLAMAHNASALRILDRRADDMALVMGNASIKDITGSNCFSPTVLQSHDNKQSRPLSVPETRQMVPIREDSTELRMPSGGSSPERALSAPKSVSRRSKISRSAKKQKALQYTDPPPLTLDNLAEHRHTLEAKTLSTNWTNYLGVGKSVFAPS